ncbi:hypothetical protein HDU85_004358 [Gaertneriomyces sp. JEL0708]|nr:hypothetical protein HDU85_004358 [Gaertneriomyces sp. JEL0708]
MENNSVEKEVVPATGTRRTIGTDGDDDYKVLARSVKRQRRIANELEQRRLLFNHLLVGTSDVDTAIRNISGSRKHHDSPGGEKTTRPVELTNVIRNDYCQNYVNTHLRPQNYICDANVQYRFRNNYPKLHTLSILKSAVVAEYAHQPLYLNADLRPEIGKPNLSAILGLQRFFDVIVVDPPLEEYVVRYPQLNDKSLDKVRPYWTWEELSKLDVGSVAATPSFIFLWVGSGGGDGLERGRELLSIWGYRRCEDICWIRSNHPTSDHPHPDDFEDSPLIPDSVLHRTKDHCLVGIRGTVRRSSDGHFIHCNVDTDVIISQPPPAATPTRKPLELTEIAERFCMGRRRLELFGEDHNIRPGWVTCGLGVSSTNYDVVRYRGALQDQFLVPTPPEVELLRPKSPPGQAAGGMRQMGRGRMGM